MALLVDDDYTLDDTAWLTPTPGHSPCHCCEIDTGARADAQGGGHRRHDAPRAAIAGSRTGLTVFDTDPLLAAKSRRSFLASVADTDTLVLPVHFPSPTVGRVGADRELWFRYRFGMG